MKSIVDEKKRPGYKVTDPEVISDIEQHISVKHGGYTRLTLYRSKLPSQKDTLHFVIESKKELDSLELSRIGVYIQEKIDFLDVSVQTNEPWKQEIFQRDFSDKVEYTASNKKNIQQFIDRNYPRFLSYQQQLKAHGCTFSESEKIELEEAEMLGKAIVETCQKEVEAHSPTKEEDISALLTNIIRLAADRGLDSSIIIEQISASRLTPLVNK